MSEEQITLTIQGKLVEGDYVYCSSPDVPGFRFLLEPGERNFDPMMGVLLECYSLHKAALMALGVELKPVANG